MKDSRMTAWFAGPSGENSDAFAEVLRKIYQDYVYWRRNYFPDDGVVVDSHAKRMSESFWDDFGDRLADLLAKLKADFPFYSPRYAAHMLSEQTLPSIAGMFAGLLYNPNNVSSEAAPVTVQMELEVAQMIADMLGYGSDGWGHLTSGGTIANIESLWVARSTLFLPLVVRGVARDLELDVPERKMEDVDLFAMSPHRALRSLHDCFEVASSKMGLGAPEVFRAMRRSEYNVVERGIGSVLSKTGASLVVLAPETHHYCIPKALDLLGIGRDSLVAVPVDSHFRMRSEALRQTVDEVERQGKTILAVVCVAGTTEEGSIDPVHEIVEVREANEQSGRQSFWIHADAAYGGYLRTMTVPHRIGLGSPRSEVMIDGEVREIDVFQPQESACDALESLSFCDSVAIDPHKLGYVPYPAGAVCFRSDLVKPVLRQDAPYIEGEAESPSRERRTKSIGVYILEGSKPGMVAAALWLSHNLIPLDCTGHGLLMQETVRNTGELYTLLKDYSEVSRGQKVRAVPLCPPGSNIVCFAFVPLDRKCSLDEVNEKNRALYERFTISETGTDIHHQEFFVSRTVIGTSHYRWETVKDFVMEIGGTKEEFEHSGAFLLRSVLMNPWYSDAKQRGRYYLSEFVAELYRQANDVYAR